MGKGLSPLQKTILATALELRQSGHQPPRDPGVDCYYPEVLTRHYGWDYNPSGFLGARGFSVQTIGAGKYRSGQVAMSRAVTRLHQRGLITVKGWFCSPRTGITLTAAGYLAAQRIKQEHAEEAS